MDTPTFHNTPNALITTDDGRQLFHSRAVAVVLALVARVGGTHFFAIEKRGTAAGLDAPGLWCLPCGYLDWDESAPEAVRREAWEEIGLDLRRLEAAALHGTSLEQPWFVASAPVQNRQNVTLRYGLIFACDALPTMSAHNEHHPDEVAETRWIQLSQVADFPFAFHHDQVIAAFARQYNLS